MLNFVMAVEVKNLRQVNVLDVELIIWSKLCRLLYYLGRFAALCFVNGGRTRK